MNDQLIDLKAHLITFREERDLKQFHKAKELALAIGIESSELPELFLWKTESQIAALAKGPQSN